MDPNMQFIRTLDWNCEKVWESNKSTQLSGMYNIMTSFVDPETGTNMDLHPASQAPKQMMKIPSTGIKS